MPPEIKKYPKKLRDREIIMVDPQLARWRKKLKKLGLRTGKAQEAKKRANERAKERKDTETAILTGKLNFFGGDE